MPQIYLLIMLTAASAGLLAGFVMHRSDFCMTATFRDIFLFKDFFLLRMLILLVVISMLLFEVGQLTGLLSPYPFPLLGAPSLATLAASIIFGTGMVLAGGCVVGSLYKFGAGSLLSGFAFLGMIVGGASYAEFSPSWNAFAQATRLSNAITLPQLFQLPATVFTFPLTVIGIIFLLKWKQAGMLNRPSFASGHLDHWKAAILLAATGFISWLMVGMPLGITTSYAKLGAMLEHLFIPVHVEHLAYFQAEPLNYVPPFGSTPISGGAGPEFDAIAAIQFPLIVGIIIGSFVSAQLTGEFRLHYRMQLRQLISALCGGFLLGMASRMVPGCNIWHLWGGLPILANQSILFLIGILPGTWLGSVVLSKYVIR